MTGTKRNPIGDFHHSYLKIQERIRSFPKDQIIISQKPLFAFHRKKEIAYSNRSVHTIYWLYKI